MKKLIISFLFLFSSFQVFGQFSEENLISYTREPQKIELGDIDNDGDNDVVVLFSQSDAVNIGWYKNLSSSEKYSQLIPIISGQSDFTKMTISDIDNDQNIDLIFADYGTLYLKKGLGDGSFEGAEIIPTAVSPINVIYTLDMDVDDDVDILIRSAHQLIKLDNDGNGNFTDEILMFDDDLFAYEEHYISDLNADGKPDLLREYSNTDELIWYENLGDSFSSGQTINDFDYITRISTGDFDGDDDEDVVVKAGNPSAIYWMENENGNGDFGDPITIVDNIFFDDLYAHVVPSDFDGDDMVDLLVLQDWNDIVWYKNINNGASFDAANYITEGQVSLGAFRTIWSGDADSDGDQDMLHIYGFEISWMPNTDGLGNFGEKKYIERNVGIRGKMIAVDLDGDEDNDLLIGGASGVHWKENLDGNGDFSAAKNIHEDPPLVSAGNIFAYDMDGDNDFDVVAEISSDIFWYQNTDGQADFSDPILIYNGVFVNHTKMIDMDNDDDLDIMGIANGPYDCFWLENVDGNFEIEHVFQNVDETYYSIGVGYVDDDDLIDLIVSVDETNVQNDNIAWHKNLGGDFGPANVILNLTAFKFSVEDIDNDGFDDVIPFNQLPRKFEWYKNLGGTGDFDDPILIENAGLYNDLNYQLVDIDDNEFIDALVGHQDSLNLRLYRNYGGIFDEPELISTIEGEFIYITTGNINNNGGVDILTTIRDIPDEGLYWYDNIETSNKIRGFTYWDENENGIKDGSEFGLNLQNVFLSPDFVTSWSNQIGEYNFSVSNGDYQVECIPSDGWQLTSQPSFDITINGSTVIQDFGLKPDENIYRGAVDISSAHTRCGFIVPFWINYQNTGTLYSDGSVALELDELVEFVFAEPAPDQILGNQLIWNFENLTPTYSNQIYLELQMPGVDNLGDTIQFLSSISLEDYSGSEVFTQETNYESEINCAYDPNDKIANKDYIDFDNYEANGDTLVYAIRFQNTGTDIAFNISLEDQLDEKLDWATFEVVSSSHNYEVYLEDNGELTFYFNNIMLPDSSENEPASHGFIKYQISPLGDLPIYTEIENYADIFFDFNPPIQTNTVIIDIDTEPPVNTLDLKKSNYNFNIMPNPSSGSVQAIFESPDLHQWGLKVYSVLGDEITSFENQNSLSKKESIYIQDLPIGMFFISLIVDDMVITKKIIVVSN